jgi:hypothetical protein
MKDKPMNQVTVRSNISAYKSFADEDAHSAIAGDMITYNKGLWVRGESKSPIESDDLFLVNLDEGYRGWVRWFAGKPTEYLIGRIVDGYQVPHRDELGHDHEKTWETDRNGNPRDPWQPTYRVVMKDGAGELCTFVGSSWGARRGLQLLYGSFDRERVDHPGEWPIVRLGTEHRLHKDYGRIPEPRFFIQNWSTWDRGTRPKALPNAGTRLAQELDDTIPFSPEYRG